MTADERIERLLNEAGQTIEDCPFFYGKGQRVLAKEAVRKRMRCGLFVTSADYQDYILHLTDVIDRMEWALDKQLHRPKHEEKQDISLSAMHLDDGQQEGEEHGEE